MWQQEREPFQDIGLSRKRKGPSPAKPQAKRSASVSRGKSTEPSAAPSSAAQAAATPAPTGPAAVEIPTPAPNSPGHGRSSHPNSLTFRQNPVLCRNSRPTMEGAKGKHCPGQMPQLCRTTCLVWEFEEIARNAKDIAVSYL